MQPIVLLFPILLPILTGVFLLLFPIRDSRRRNIVVEVLVILNSLITLALLFHRPEETLTLFTLGTSLTLALRIDGLGLLFSGMIALLWPFATLYAFEYMRREERVNTFLAFYTITYGVTIGIAFSANIITMYLFYELLTIVTLPLVMHNMTREARVATRKYLYYMVGGAAFGFIAIVFYTLVCTDLEFVLGGNLDVSLAQEYGPILLLVYVIGFMGFGVKAAVFPFHGWLPTASVAPTPVTALLHAVAVVKAGVFSIIRLTYYCFGTELLRGTWAQTVVIGIVMFTIAYASTMGVRETHVKRRLAYSTVSNLSYILLGVTLMSPAGLAAGLAHMLVHAVMKINGFFCAGAIKHQTGKDYIYELDGLGQKMPVTFIALLVSALSLTGIPLTGGFVSKWQLADALLGQENLLGYLGVAVLLYSALMTGIYMFTMVIRGWFPEAVSQRAGRYAGTFRRLARDGGTGDGAGSLPGERSEDMQNHMESEKGHFARLHHAVDAGDGTGITDPGWQMKLPLLLFSAVTILIGVHAQPLLDFVGRVAQGLMD